MSPDETIPDFETLRERQRAIKSETLRLAQHGIFVHESEILYADEIGAWLDRIEGRGEEDK